MDVKLKLVDYELGLQLAVYNPESNELKQNFEKYSKDPSDLRLIVNQNIYFATESDYSDLTSTLRGFLYYPVSASLKCEIVSRLYLLIDAKIENRKIFLDSDPESKDGMTFLMAEGYFEVYD